jgi:hypothetical protein
MGIAEKSAVLRPSSMNKKNSYGGNTPAMLPPSPLNRMRSQSRAGRQRRGSRAGTGESSSTSHSRAPTAGRRRRRSMVELSDYSAADAAAMATAAYRKSGSLRGSSSTASLAPSTSVSAQSSPRTTPRAPLSLKLPGSSPGSSLTQQPRTWQERRRRFGSISDKEKDDSSVDDAEIRRILARRDFSAETEQAGSDHSLSPDFSRSGSQSRHASSESPSVQASRRASMESIASDDGTGTGTGTGTVAASGVGVGAGSLLKATTTRRMVSLNTSSTSRQSGFGDNTVHDLVSPVSSLGVSSAVTSFAADSGETGWGLRALLEAKGVLQSERTALLATAMAAANGAESSATGHRDFIAVAQTKHDESEAALLTHRNHLNELVALSLVDGVSDVDKSANAAQIQVANSDAATFETAHRACIVELASAKSAAIASHVEDGNGGVPIGFDERLVSLNRRIAAVEAKAIRQEMRERLKAMHDRQKAVDVLTQRREELDDSAFDRQLEHEQSVSLFSFPYFESE